MTALPPPTADAPGRPEVVRRAAKTWSGQIIDLGGRNTLLFYKDLKVGTIDLTPSEEIDPPTIAALLDGRTVRLSQIVAPNLLTPYARRARVVKARATENFEERGLQTLFLAYGMATWTLARSNATPAAPVLLVPLRLAPRGGAAEDFDLELQGDWEVNPTLLHLLRTEFRVALDADELLGDDDDLDRAIRLLKDRCVEVPGFSIKDRVVVGNFSYAKQPMALDIDGSIEAMIAHPIVAAIAGAHDAQRELIDRQPVVEISLPDTTPPSDEFLILDADASQSYVINAAIRGANLVVQGPPGTGKSQTIANLIATLAARGMSTLFVAEKRAAIEAVTNRLDYAGLDSLVMDLHGGTGSRRAVLAQIGRALDGIGEIPAVDRSVDEVRLKRSRNKLRTFAEELHRPRDGEHLSVFDIQSMLLGIPETARGQITLPKSVVEALPWSALESTEDAIAEWVQLGGSQLGTGVHAWGVAVGRITSQHAAEQALDIARQLASSTSPTASRQRDAALTEIGFRRPKTISEWGTVIGLLSDVDSTLAAYDPGIHELDFDTHIAELEPADKSAVPRAMAALFNGQYRAAKKAVAALSKRQRSSAELRADVVAARAQAAAWETWCVDGRTPRRPSTLEQSQRTFSDLTTQLAALAAYVGDNNAKMSLDENRERATALVDDRTMLFRMPRIHDIRKQLSGEGFIPVIDEVIARQLDPDTARALVRHTWLKSKLDAIRLSAPVIGNFDGAAQSSTVRDFRRTDAAHIESGSQRVRRQVAERAIITLNAHQDQAQLVRQQAGRKRGHLPLRELLQQAPDVLIAVKPCWAMSPLVVSQLLPSDPPLFDFVIFDEASQIPPAEAIPAILRGNHLIVAGDSRQLPPTTFFATSNETEDASDADAALVTEDMESILDSMIALLPPPHGSKTLRWHYRSRDERLIAFSNAQPSLYDWSMTTFPGVGIDKAVDHIHVPWQPGAHGEENSATEEVRAVVSLVAEHARSSPDDTMGIITMGIKHADRIAEAIRLERKTDRALDEFCSSHPDEPFFVKNLERVQGDERDNIVLSIGYGKSADGRMVYRFGPLLQQGGERRLNVAVTRAKRGLTVVSSFGAEDLADERLTSEGARMLKRYLTYTASGGTDLGAVAKIRPALNPFEMDVQRGLTQAGIPLTPQLGASGYWIDFAAAHPTFPGRYVLAIEADGAAYHSSATARDRDRLRQDHLERLGWTFHRIWSTDWFNHRDREVERAVEAWGRAVDSWDSGERTVPNRLSPRPSGVATPFAPPVEAPSTPAGARTAQRPLIGRGEPITSYSNAHLDQLIRWIRSDTLLRTDDELITVAIEELGYRRRGSRIVTALQAAIDRTLPTSPVSTRTSTGPAAATTPAAPSRPSPAHPPAGWFADPTSRHEFRYWNGERWTEQASRGGQILVDPI